MSKECPECRSTELRMDEQGGVHCRHCGLMVRENIDTGPNWRAYDPATSQSGPPASSDLSTTVSSTHDAQGKPLTEKTRQQAASIRHWQKQIRLSRAGGRTIMLATREIERLSGMLILPQPARDLAMDLFRRASQRGSVRGRATESVAAALTYAACRLVQLPRTIDEVADHTHLHRIELSRLYRNLARELKLALPPPSAVDFLPRFTSELQLPQQTEQLARELLTRALAEGMTGGASPTALAGASLYLACRLTNERRSQGLVAEVAGVTEVTIRNRYKGLRRKLDV